MQTRNIIRNLPDWHSMKTTSIAATLALAFLMLGNTVVGSAMGVSAADQTTSTILSQLNRYVSTIPPNHDHTLCLTGTLDPLTINDVSCADPRTQRQSTQYILNCDDPNTIPKDNCQAGVLYTLSTNDSYFTGSATRPSSLPSTTYCGPPSPNNCAITGRVRHITYTSSKSECTTAQTPATPHKIQSFSRNTRAITPQTNLE